MYVYCVYCLPVCLFTHHHVTYPETATIQQRFSSTEKKKKGYNNFVHFISVWFECDTLSLLFQFWLLDALVVAVNNFRTLSFEGKFDSICLVKQYRYWTKFFSMLFLFDFFRVIFCYFFYLFILTEVFLRIIFLT